MKKLTFLVFFLIAFSSLSASGQYRGGRQVQQIYYTPCLVNTRPMQPAPTMVYNPNTRMYEMPRPDLGAWEQPIQDEQVLKINAGQLWVINIVMPVDGTCGGGFESKDNRADSTKLIENAAGQYVRVPIEVQGDIEIMFLDEYNFAAFMNGASYTAAYSTGRQYSGKFLASLRAGYYRLVISNQHSALASKSVRFRLGAELDRMNELNLPNN